jgi:hypothetical protein
MSLRRPPLFKRTSDATKLPLEPFTGPLVNSLTPLARADLWRSRARTNSAQLRSSYCRISAMDYSKTSPERIGTANGGSQPTMPHQVSSLRIPSEIPSGGSALQPTVQHSRPRCVPRLIDFFYLDICPQRESGGVGVPMSCHAMLTASCGHPRSGSVRPRRWSTPLAWRRLSLLSSG